MEPEFLTEVEQAYNEACQLAPDHRNRFLLDSYSHRPDIIEEVLSLLKHQNDADSFNRSIVLAAAAEFLQDVDNVIGSVVGGRYLIRRCIGSGAMSEVYLADHVDLDTPFALKRPKPELRDDPNYILGLSGKACSKI